MSRQARNSFAPQPQDDDPVPAPRRHIEPAPPRPVVPPRGGSAAHLIYREVREEIVSLRRKPGEPIVERQIALKRGVSRTPVREALLRLSDEALVDIFPQSGTFVARIPVSALPEAILMRTALEQTTARLAAERADAAEVARLNGLIDRQRRLAARGERDRFHAADEAFHAAIAAAAGHPGIWRFIEQVKIQVDRYRRLTLPVPGRMGQVVDETLRLYSPAWVVARHATADSYVSLTDGKTVFVPKDAQVLMPLFV